MKKTKLVKLIVLASAITTVCGLFVGCGTSKTAKTAQSTEQQEQQEELPPTANIVSTVYRANSKGEGSLGVVVNINGKLRTMSISDVEVNADVTSIIGCKAKIEDGKITDIVPNAKKQPNGGSDADRRDMEVVDYQVKNKEAVIQVYYAEEDTVKSYVLDDASARNYSAKNLIGKIIKINFGKKDVVDSIEIVG